MTRDRAGVTASTWRWVTVIPTCDAQVAGFVVAFPVSADGKGVQDE